MTWSISVENTGIATAVISNILLGAAINLHKYAKRQIILMALHGLPAVNLQRLWYVALSMLFASECANFVAFGLVSAATMTPVGVFTVISNCVFPPLAFESHMHTSLGSLISMPGILLLITMGSKVEPPLSGFTISSRGKILLEAELAIGIMFALIRAYKPANCSLKLGANCGLGALMGSYSVTAIKALMSTDLEENGQVFCMSIFLVTSVLELILLTESLQSFPVWQVVPHHFSMFIMSVYLNSGALFGQFEEIPESEILWSLLAYLLITIGVWVSAKPHLDIPIDIKEDAALLQHLAREASQRCASESSSQASNIEASSSSSIPGSHSTHNTDETHPTSAFILDNDMLREEYARYRHEELKSQVGFRRCQKPLALHPVNDA